MRWTSWFATAISVCLAGSAAAGKFNTTQVNIKILNMNVWGVKFFSKERRARMRGTAEFLRASDYDLVFIQELWYQEDFQLLAATFPYSTRQASHLWSETENVLFVLAGREHRAATSVPPQRTTGPSSSPPWTATGSPSSGAPFVGVAHVCTHHTTALCARPTNHI